MNNTWKAFTFISAGGLLLGYVVGITSSVIAEGQLLCRKPSTPVTFRSANSGEVTSLLQAPIIRNPSLLQIHYVAKHGGPTSSLNLLSQASGYNKCFDLDPFAIGFLASCNLIGAIVASVFCFRYADGLGRKVEVQLAATFYILGAFTAAASQSLWGIFAGFLIYGLGIGVAMHAAPIYLAEIAPADTRGTLISAKEATIVFGMVLGFLAGYLFQGFEFWGWRCMVLGSVVFALIMGVGILSIPESPRWLELKQLQGEARSSLQFFRETASLQEVDDELKAIHADAVSITSSNPFTDCFQYPRPMLIACGLVFLQQVTGQPTILYFASNICRRLEFGSSSALSSVGIGVVKLVATLYSTLRVDRHGRRVLLYLGIAMMTLALLTLSFGTRRQEDGGETTKTQQWISFCALLFYVCGYQIGFGPIAWLLLSEVFPLHVKGAAISVAAIVNFASNMVMTLIQPALIEAMHLSGVFMMYTVLSAMSLLFVWRLVPETKGKTLEEISAELCPDKRS